MAGELLCPDCGGVVGATETTEAGPPCTCFTSSSSDTAVDMPSPAGEKQEAKICVLCGKDVTGHRRLKDSRGMNPGLRVYPQTRRRGRDFDSVASPIDLSHPRR